eukprot:GEMP01025053.1.p1 GENE.GEMP01025053.1~~GEMP01025053.1.p1  ORF type:complete len:537 (+),score=132.56 GEMP01025053.1:163-1773(+)
MALWRSLLRRANLVGVDSTVIYANPICSQLDQLVNKATTTEDVLGLLVTHRGVFFVHNLVTALGHLSTLERGENAHIEVNELLRDFRYDVLLRDLIHFLPKLDFQAISLITASFKLLDHKYYPFFHAALDPLENLPIPSIDALLRCTDTMVWAGYVHHMDFWQRAAAYFSAEKELSRQNLLHAVQLFAALDKYYPEFFARAEKDILAWDWSRASGQEVAIVAKSFVTKTHHPYSTHRALFDHCIAHLTAQSATYPLKSLTHCVRAFRAANIRCDAAVARATSHIAAACKLSVHKKKRCADLSVRQVAAICESVAHFGMYEQCDLTELYAYMEHFVADVGEHAAIDAVFALSAQNKVSDFPTLLEFCWRRIGRGTHWEQHKRRIFGLWLCQLIQFPYIECNLPKRCVVEGLRAWLLHRRGYDVAFPEEVAQMSEYLTALNIPHESCVELDGPYVLDVVLPNRTVLTLTSEVTVNTGDACGLAWLQANHLRMWGYRMVPIPITAWRRLVEPKEYLRGLTANWQALSAGSGEDVAVLAS